MVLMTQNTDALTKRRQEMNKNLAEVVRAFEADTNCVVKAIAIARDPVFIFVLTTVELPPQQ